MASKQPSVSSDAKARGELKVPEDELGDFMDVLTDLTPQDIEFEGGPVDGGDGLYHVTWNTV